MYKCESKENYVVVHSLLTPVVKWRHGYSYVRPNIEDRSLASPGMKYCALGECSIAATSELLINHTLSAHGKKRVSAHLLLLAVYLHSQHYCNK